ncbi:alpha/beta hydrolase [Chitinophaga agri]|uniref:Alpha/beta hydrolase n=1 Tax=Chitinophaga agri TaxID=2703787 RepID=A0A6B9ZB64_9BACT|nr:alpha/beta hydrolase-fold protein [Chitinophaga agri]QHS59356.1 alpha/beta hydrolase [Chitinophaga agri]
MKRLYTLLLPLLFLLLRSSAQQTTPLPIGVVQHFQSAILNEKRQLNIYLPQDYQHTSRTYPVIYLLDGGMEEDFLHITGLTQFLTMIDTLPPSIVVGIVNTDRKRDYTFPTTISGDKKKFPTTGGSANFISCLEKEIQPLIRKQYRVNDTTTLIGQSLGGLLATEILLKHPGLFMNYAIISPSLWWNGGSLLTEAPYLFAATPDVPTHIFVAVGQEHEQMMDAASELGAIFQASKKKNLYAQFVFMPKENHLTILHNAVYKALEVFNTKRR